ncbi:MAG: STAS domain-containing protein [Chloroflexota bacterium]
MNEQTLSLNVRHVDGCGIIDIIGDVTMKAEDPLMNAYHKSTAGDRNSIILNFSGLEYMNSTGIGLLVTLLIRVQRHNQQLFAFGLDEHYRQIFELTRLDEAIQICDSEADAIAKGAVAVS